METNKMSYCINRKCNSRQQDLSISTECDSCGTSLIVYGNYHLIEDISKPEHNQEWEVFIIEHIKSKQKAVVKLLSLDENTLLTNEQRNLNDKFEYSFNLEKTVLLELDDRRIPRFIASGSLPVQNSTLDIRYIIMEWIDGVDLSEWVMSDNRLSRSGQALAWLRQVINTLGKLHFKNYLHRDIKPSNIMLRGDNLILIDFGGAKGIHPNMMHGSPLTGIYSNYYSPPEQTRRPSEPVKQSDIYSVAKTFVCLLTGRDPSESDIDWHHQTDLVNSPFILLLNWMKEQEVSNRPQNTIEVLDVIDFLERQPCPSREDTKAFIDKIKSDRNTGLIRFANRLVEYFSLFSITKNTMQNQPKPKQGKRLNKKVVLILLSLLILIIIIFKDPILALFLTPEVTTSYSINSVDVSSLPKELKYMTGSSEVPMFRIIENKIGGRKIKLTKVLEKTSCKGSNTSIERLMNSENGLNFVLSSVRAKQEELESITIAKDRIAVVVGQSFENEIKKIQGLTIDDLVNIYTGKYTNWNQIDRKIGDITISAYSKNPNCSGTAEVFQEQVLGNKGTIDNKLIHDDLSTHDILKKLNNDAPGSIYYMSLPEVETQFIVPIKNEANEFLPASTDKERPAKPNTQKYRFVLKRSLYLVYKKDHKAMGDIITKLIRSKDIQDKFQELGFESI